MEREVYLSGYCRQLDSSRIVEAVLEGKELQEVDCLYENCVYRSNCPVAKQIDALTEA